MTAPRKSVDWERIEAEYRAGQLSLGEIARSAGISRQAITKRAEKAGWTRNLAAKVRERVAAKLVEVTGAEVTGEVTGSDAHAREAATVEVAAERAAAVVLTHRRDILAAREAVGKLVDRLARSGSSVELPQAASAAASLATALGKLVALERQAFALDKPHEEEKADEAADAAAEALRGMLDDLSLIHI